MPNILLLLDNVYTFIFTRVGRVGSGHGSTWYQLCRSVVSRFLCRQSIIVCHTRAVCLNRSTDLDAIWIHCVAWGP